MSRKLTILVVDDTEMNQRLLASFIEHLGHHCQLAGNGLEAVEFCRAHRPDVILMDVMMPVMDGFQATREIRALLGEHWIPIIFLTALSERTDLLRGLESGGDDYLTKPIDLAMLSAKMKVLLRISSLQQRITTDTERLEAYYRNNEQETVLAKHVLENFTRRAESALPHIRQWLLPALNFSGDVVSFRKSPTGVDHILLADSTGHGLAAAISCLPAVDLFVTRTASGYSIGQIARSINAKLHSLLPVGRFVAAALVAIDHDARTLHVWNGGIPCVFYLNREGRLEKGFKSGHPPLGILPDADFDTRLEIHRWQQPGELILCSDGVTEAGNGTGDYFGMKGVVSAALESEGRDTLTAIAEALQVHLQGKAPQDDVSLVVASCRPGDAVEIATEAEPERQPALSGWDVRLQFRTEQLRQQDCIPVLVGWLNQLGLTRSQLSDSLHIVTELFNHGLDTHLLQLPSTDDMESEHLSSHGQLRQERLDALVHGELDIAMSRQEDDAGPVLVIRLHARGAMAAGLPVPLRGKVVGLCEQLSVSEDGASIEARYRLRN